MIGLIVPTYNRRKNLSLLLGSLRSQTCKKFVVVIADNGSTDDTRKFIDTMMLDNFWQKRLFYCYIDEVGNRGLARNKGEEALPSYVKGLLFLDSDILLNDKAIEYYQELGKTFPKSIIYGQVDWLPNIPDQEIRKNLKDLSKLRGLIKTKVPRREGGTFVGKEVRLTVKFDDSQVNIEPRNALFLNTLVSREIFRKIKFDTKFCGYGYEDIDLGYQAQKAGYTCVYSSRVWGLHIWHDKGPDIKRECSNNLDRLIQKHGQDDYLTSEAQRLKIEGM